MFYSYVTFQTEQVEEQDVSSDDEEYRQTSIRRQKSVKRQITVDDKMQLENIDDEVEKLYHMCYIHNHNTYCVEQYYECVVFITYCPLKKCIVYHLFVFYRRG